MIVCCLLHLCLDDCLLFVAPLRFDLSLLLSVTPWPIPTDINTRSFRIPSPTFAYCYHHPHPTTLPPPAHHVFSCEVLRTFRDWDVCACVCVYACVRASAPVGHWVTEDFLISACVTGRCYRRYCNSTALNVMRYHQTSCLVLP